MCRVDGCGRGRGCGSASYEGLVVIVGCCLLLQEIRVLCMLCHCYNWLQLLDMLGVLHLHVQVVHVARVCIEHALCLWLESWSALTP